MKNLNVKKNRICIILFLAICFGNLLSCSKKTIKGDYYIERFEEGEPTYYINQRGIDSGGGVFDGIVLRILVTDGDFYAEIQRLSSSDKNGWYKLNLDTGVVIGPVEIPAKGTSIISVESYYENL